MWALGPQLTKNDGTAPVEQNAMLGVPLNGSGEGEAFDVTPDRGQLLRLVTMVDPGNLLFDDRAFVERRGHIMSRCADELHAAKVGLVVRAGAGEARQERVVNVDHTPLQPLTQVVGEHLHVPREYDEVHSQSSDQLGESRLRLDLGVRRDWYAVIRDAVRFDQAAKILMIRHDCWQVDSEVIAPPAIEQVVQTVPEAGHHDEHARRNGEIV